MSYLIEQTVLVQLCDLLEIKIGDRIVYARNVKIYKGVDNTIKLVFVNQDQKRVPIQDKTITLHIFHPEDSSIVVSTPVLVSASLIGIGTAKVLNTDIEFLVTGYYTFAIEVISGEGEDEIAYADDNYGAGGQVELIEGKYPYF